MFLVALGGGLVLLAGISGPHMGAAIFAGYLAIVLGVLGLNVLIALSLVLPKRVGLALFGVVAALVAVYLGQRVQQAVREKQQQARAAASERIEREWQETILSLPRAQLLEWLKDGSFDARRPPGLSPSSGLRDRAEAMAQACELDGDLLAAIARRQPFSRDEMINLLDDVQSCPSTLRQAWLDQLRPELFAVKDAAGRRELAEELLRVDVSGSYLRQFVAAGYRIDDATPEHPPLLFEVLDGDEAMLARTRVLLDLGARRDLKNAEGLTPAAFLERRARATYSGGEIPEEWRATLALLR